MAACLVQHERERLVFVVTASSVALCVCAGICGALGIRRAAAGVVSVRGASAAYPLAGVSCCGL